jgi:MFS family permease
MAGRPGVHGQLVRLYLGCLLAACSYGLTLLLPALVKAAGGSEAQTGLIYWCGALGALGALVGGGRLTPRIGAGRAAALGSGLYTLAAGILAGTGPRGAGSCAAGVLLGAGWALVFTSSPIIASSTAGAAQARTRFQVLAGFNALGIGTGPIAGQLLVAHGLPGRGVFALAAVLSLAAGVLFCRPAGLLPPAGYRAGTETARCGVIGPVRLILASRSRPFLLMVALGACVFTTMTTDQAALAASRGLSSQVFFACYTLGVIIPRFTVTRVLARTGSGWATTALLAGMCLSLGGFLLPGRDLILYAASSALLGLTYGLAYPLIQGRAADGAPPGLRQWALWYFSVAYFAGLYGFPLLAGTIITRFGYQPLVAILLALATVELAISVKTQHAPAAGPS